MPRPLFVTVFCMVSWLATHVAAEQPRTKIDLASNGIGAPPADFEFRQSGPGEAGQWAIVRDPTAATAASIQHVSTDTADDRYPLAIYKPISAKNVEVSAHVKVVRGRMESAGIAVRLVSPDNYYVARVNALEERVELVRVVNGKTEQIAGTETDVYRDHWHTLGIRVEDERFTVSIDGKLLFTAFDRTFLRDGQVALWTEEDNVTRFEEIEIAALPFSAKDQ